MNKYLEMLKELDRSEGKDQSFCDDPVADVKSNTVISGIETTLAVDKIAVTPPLSRTAKGTIKAIFHAGFCFDTDEPWLSSEDSTVWTLADMRLNLNSPDNQSLQIDIAHHRREINTLLGLAVREANRRLNLAVKDLPLELNELTQSKILDNYDYQQIGFGIFHGGNLRLYIKSWLANDKRYPFPMITG